MVAFTSANSRASAERYSRTTAKGSRFRSGSQVILRPSVEALMKVATENWARVRARRERARRHNKRATENMLLVAKCRRKHWTKGTDLGAGSGTRCLNNHRWYKHPHPGR
jgi:hypothetical protein